jgi:hypothetical protein
VVANQSLNVHPRNAAYALCRDLRSSRLHQCVVCAGTISPTSSPSSLHHYFFDCGNRSNTRLIFRSTILHNESLALMITPLCRQSGMRNLQGSLLQRWLDPLHTLLQSWFNLRVVMVFNTSTFGKSSVPSWTPFRSLCCQTFLGTGDEEEERCC